MDEVASVIRYLFAPCCGLQRTAPLGCEDGLPFDLVPCPKCKAPFHGRAIPVPSDLDPESTTYVIESLPWPSTSASPKSSGPSASSAQ